MNDSKISTWFSYGYGKCTCVYFTLIVFHILQEVSAQLKGVCLRFAYLKICGYYLVVFFNGIPIFEWCAVSCGYKNTHHEDTCLKEIALRVYTLLSTLNSMVITIGKTYVFTWGINKHAILMIITKQWEGLNFDPIFVDISPYILLM